MTLQRWMIIHAFLWGTAGLTALAAPSLWLQLYGLDGTAPGEQAFARLGGMALLGMALLIACARSLTAGAGRRWLTGWLLGGTFVGLLGAFSQQYTIWNSATGWSTVLLHLVLTAGYGRFLAQRLESLQGVWPPTSSALKSTTLLRFLMLVQAVLQVGAGLNLWLASPPQPWFTAAQIATGYAPHAFGRLTGLIFIAFCMLLVGMQAAIQEKQQRMIASILLIVNLGGLGLSLTQPPQIGRPWQVWVLAGACILLGAGYTLVLGSPWLKRFLQGEDAQVGRRVGSASFETSLVFLAALALASGGGAGFAIALAGSMSVEKVILIGSVNGIILGIPVALWMSRRMQSLEEALERLVDHQPLELPLGEGWPLGRIAAKLNMLHQEAEQGRSERATLAQQVSLAAAQQERNHLAQELHDSIKQQLYSIQASAAATQARWSEDPERAQACLEDVRQNPREAMVEMNALLLQLRPAPLENVGLIEALREQCEALGYRTGATVNSHFAVLPPVEQFPLGTQEALFRIAQEAFSNIARHARATQVELQLSCLEDQTQVQLVLSDNGQGFDLATTPKGMGLQNMVERAQLKGGKMELESQPGAGTRLVACLPLCQPVAACAPNEMLLLAQLATFERSLAAAGVVFIFALGLVVLAEGGLFALNSRQGWGAAILIGLMLSFSVYQAWQAWRVQKGWRGQPSEMHPTMLRARRAGAIWVFYAGSAVFGLLPWFVHRSTLPILSGLGIALLAAGIAAVAFVTQHRLTQALHAQLAAPARRQDLAQLWQMHWPIWLVELFVFGFGILFTSPWLVLLGILLVETVFLGYLLWLDRKIRQED